MKNEYGVLQGSVLGPLLFLICINDIGYIPKLLYKPKIFADDTNLFVNSPTLHELNINCQSSINLISDWVLANKLTINFE